MKVYHWLVFLILANLNIQVILFIQVQDDVKKLNLVLEHSLIDCVCTFTVKHVSQTVH